MKNYSQLVKLIIKTNPELDITALGEEFSKTIHLNHIKNLIWARLRYNRKNVWFTIGGLWNDKDDLDEQSGTLKQFLINTFILKI